MCYNMLCGVSTLSRKAVNMKYQVFCGEILIGKLEISDDEKQHRYTPNEDGVKAAKSKFSLSHDMVEPSDWREPIPFFKNRIENAKRFSNGDVITSHTDPIRMVKE